jgi:hypothetical protein
MASPLNPSMGGSPYAKTQPTDEVRSHSCRPTWSTERPLAAIMSRSNTLDKILAKAGKRSAPKPTQLLATPGLGIVGVNGAMPAPPPLSGGSSPSRHARGSANTTLQPEHR